MFERTFAHVKVLILAKKSKQYISRIVLIYLLHLEVDDITLFIYISTLSTLYNLTIFNIRYGIIWYNDYIILNQLRGYFYDMKRFEI